MRTLWLALVAIGCLLLGCNNDLCGNQPLSEQRSPDGKWKYVAFDRNCGATTASNFQVSVLPAALSLPNESGNAFAGDYNHGAASYVADVEWIGSNTLQIGYSPKARIFRKESRVGPIEIKYVVKR
jgi:hypothetical protein